jgi:hypothetical protein
MQASTGLLSAGILGGPTDEPSQESDRPTIIIDVPMRGQTNQYVNFARLAEQKYGWNALHPRASAHKDRMAKIAAAGAALEKGSATGGSGDEMNIDGSDSDTAPENNIPSGSGAEASGQAGTERKRRRRKKGDEYDKEDPFVDDSELVWENEAAASKDGFFVFNGPLVPKGEQANVERYISSLLKKVHTY